MTYKLLPVFLLFATLTASQKQEGRISGTVYSDQGNPVPDAYVQITGYNNTVITKKDGTFSIEKLSPGRYSLKIDHVSFFPFELEDVAVRPGIITKLDSITLLPRIFDASRVTVTATRIERSPDQITQQVNIVASDEINRRQAATAAEALREEAGLFIQKTGHGGGSANIRGFSSNQILLEVDGIRLNNSIYRLGNHQYLTTVDNMAAARIEVVRGPTSVIHGSDALGGTINILTSRPQLYRRKFEISGGLLSRYSSADAEKMLHGHLEAGKNNFAFRAGFSLKDFSDLRRGQNSSKPQLEKATNGAVQSPSGFTGYDFDAKLLYGIRPGHTLTAAYQESQKENVPRYDKYENDGFDRWIYQPQTRRMAFLRYENNIPGVFFTSSGITLSWQQQAEGREIRPEPASALTMEKDDVRTYGIGLQFGKRYDGHDILIGGELYRDRIRSSRLRLEANGSSTMETRARYPNGALYNSLGLFIQDEIIFTGNLRFLLGLRYSSIFTRFDIEDDFNPAAGKIDLNFSSVTGSMGAAYHISPDLRLTANLSQGFRAPNLSDLSKFGESKGNTYEVPNSRLVPEKVLGFDAGINFENPWGSVSFSAFYTRVSDLISSAEDTFQGVSTIERDSIIYRVKSKQNTGRAYITGIESSMRFSIAGEYDGYFRLAAIYGRNISLREPLGGIPPLHGILGVKREGKDIYAEIFVRFALRQDKLSRDDLDDPRIPPGGTPGWWTLNLRAGYSFLDWLYVQAGLENAADINYREHGSGINGPGRNLRLTLRMDL